MSGLARLAMMGLVAGAAAWGGLTAGERGVTITGLRETVVGQVAVLMGREAEAMPAAVPSGAVVYWRHPDGLPEWWSCPGSGGNL